MPMWQRPGVAQEIQRSADALTKVWQDYTPTDYPGSMLLITADIKDFRPGIIDDDPLLGWSGMIGGGVSCVPCGRIT